MNVLDLCSGIGSFSLGLEAAGMHTVAFCEIDPYCQEVLAQNWPETPIHNDLRSLDGKQFKGIDVVCAGYPCQGESIAGARLGEKDIRSLCGEALRIIEDSETRYVILENVVGHISSQFDSVCTRLEALNFTVWPLDIYSSAIGLPTVERHIWIVAAANGKRQQGEWKAEIQNQSAIQRKFPRSDKGGYGRWNLSSSRVCRVGERPSRRRERLIALGNTVPPEFPYIIGQAIMQHESEAVSA